MIGLISPLRGQVGFSVSTLRPRSADRYKTDFIPHVESHPAPTDGDKLVQHQHVHVPQCINDTDEKHKSNGDLQPEEK